MRRIAVFLLFGMTLGIASCANVYGMPESRPANFEFVFRDRACGPQDNEVLDTAKGILVYTPPMAKSMTVPFRLTDDEMDRIYKKIAFVNFFGYPSNFVIPEENRRGIQTPAATYQLSVIMGTRTGTVTWMDDIIADPAYEQASRLRELMVLIDKIIYSHPEYQLLPKPSVGCA